MNKLIIFDMDGTLTESKQLLTTDMAKLLTSLLAETRVAIISGGALPQFLKQIVTRLPNDANLANLYILPTSGAALYEYYHSTSFDFAQDKPLGTSWKKIYEERLSEKEAHTIEKAMREAAEETGIINFLEQSWGERIEYRGSQVSMSALGQQAPVTLKKAWDPGHAKRRMLQANIADRLPEFEVRYGGSTTIDVTKKGIDKAYGIRKLCNRLGVLESESLYIGDELEKGGNDEAVYKTSVQTRSVRNPSETSKLIELLISNA